MAFSSAVSKPPPSTSFLRPTIWCKMATVSASGVAELKKRESAVISAPLRISSRSSSQKLDIFIARTSSRTFGGVGESQRRLSSGSSAMDFAFFT